jgi:hypothetical protein
MRLLYSLLFIALSAQFAFAQFGPTAFRRSLPNGGAGGNSDKILQITDSRFLVAGKTDGVATAYVVDRSGNAISRESFRATVGGIRSEFTDALRTTDGYIFTGDCDDCVTGTPGRQIFILKTDASLGNRQIKYIGKPVEAPATNTVFGYQRIRQIGNDFVVVANLINAVGADTSSNLAVIRTNPSLDVQYNRFYNLSRYDNLGDFEVRNNEIYIISWNLRYYGIGGDSSTLIRMDGNGGILARRNYPFVGTALMSVPNSTDWIIGGAETVDLANGPQATLARVDADGAIKGRARFGSVGKIDMVWDVQPLANGNLLVAASFNQQYPRLPLTPNPELNIPFLDFTKYTYPYAARVLRFNASNLQLLGFNQVANPTAAAVIVRSVLPLNSDGTEFVSCGYWNNTPLFYSFAEPAVQVQQPADERTEPTEMEVVAKVTPNPARTGVPVALTIDNATENLQVEVMDVAGRLIRKMEANVLEGGVALPEFAAPGMYFVRLSGSNGVVKTVPVQVQ